MLVKIKIKEHNFIKIKKMIEFFKGKIINTNINYYIIEIIGNNKKLNLFLKILNNIAKTAEIVRSGIIGISR